MSLSTPVSQLQESYSESSNMGELTASIAAAMAANQQGAINSNNAATPVNGNHVLVCATPHTDLCSLCAHKYSFMRPRRDCKICGRIVCRNCTMKIPKEGKEMRVCSYCLSTNSTLKQMTLSSSNQNHASAHNPHPQHLLHPAHNAHHHANTASPLTTTTSHSTAVSESGSRVQFSGFEKDSMKSDGERSIANSRKNSGNFRESWPPLATEVQMSQNSSHSNGEEEKLSGLSLLRKATMRKLGKLK
jgi:hypothetical protein